MALDLSYDKWNRINYYLKSHLFIDRTQRLDFFDGGEKISEFLNWDNYEIDLRDRVKSFSKKIL